MQERSNKVPNASPEDSASCCVSPASRGFPGSREGFCSAQLPDGGKCGLKLPCPVHKGPHHGNVAVVRLPPPIAKQIGEMIRSGAFRDESEALCSVWEWYWEIMPSAGAKKFVTECRKWEEEQP